MANDSVRIGLPPIFFSFAFGVSRLFLCLVPRSVGGQQLSGSREVDLTAASETSRLFFATQTPLRVTDTRPDVLQRAWN